MNPMYPSIMTGISKFLQHVFIASIKSKDANFEEWFMFKNMKCNFTVVAGPGLLWPKKQYIMWCKFCE